MCTTLASPPVREEELVVSGPNQLDEDKNGLEQRSRRHSSYCGTLISLAAGLKGGLHIITNIADGMAFMHDTLWEDGGTNTTKLDAKTPTEAKSMCMRREDGGTNTPSWVTADESPQA
ncbi:Os02g0757600 [Oryza sativa Japonica Group]|uniref:Os02g0757600 protein n=3 Tax=Oryza sativa subsp. japonica TaxID=39947 RepID=Q6Z7V7_ORYSJ|nr:hypothetical protein [Oryza sativa Japonica Group]BAS81002.1 Os02g0757600 [Oryza sativa Japonica Group]